MDFNLSIQHSFCVSMKMTKIYVNLRSAKLVKRGQTLQRKILDSNVKLTTYAIVNNNITIRVQKKVYVVTWGLRTKSFVTYH